MPVATLSFDLETEDEEFKAATQAMLMKCAIHWFFEGSLRKRLKYGSFEGKELELLEALRDEFLAECREFL